MKLENVVMVAIGVFLFLLAGNLSRESYTYGAVVGLLGLVLLYLGLKREEDRKKGKNK